MKNIKTIVNGYRNGIYTAEHAMELIEKELNKTLTKIAHNSLCETETYESR